MLMGDIYMFKCFMVLPRKHGTDEKEAVSELILKFSRQNNILGGNPNAIKKLLNLLLTHH